MGAVVYSMSILCVHFTWNFDFDLAHLGMFSYLASIAAIQYTPNDGNLFDRANG